MNYLQFGCYIPFPCNSCPYYWGECCLFCIIDEQMIISIEMGF